MVNFRHDTTKEWKKINPILKKGEFGIEFCNNGITKMKIGNGKSKWSELKYLTIDKTDFEKLLELYYKTHNARIKLKIDYDYMWQDSDIILLRGEPAFEIASNGVNMKVGDGHNKWNELEYVVNNSNKNEKENIHMTNETKKVLLSSVILNIIMALVMVISNTM